MPPQSALNDPEILKCCIPGCQSLEMASPTAMTAIVLLNAGPVKATFSGKVTLNDIDAPSGYHIVGEGAADFATGGAKVAFAEETRDVTILHDEAEAQIGSTLAQLGARLIGSTSRKLAANVFENFAAVVAPSS